MRKSLLATIIAMTATSFVPRSGVAQADALGGLLGNATDFDLFWTWAGSPRGALKPEGSSSANGVGFELAFEIPGGYERTRRPPKSGEAIEGNSCEARFSRGELKPRQACGDTTVSRVTRTRSGRPTATVSYDEELSIKAFEWTEPIAYFELAVGFSQAGAYVSRNPGNDVRVSVREAPSVSVYANYQPNLPVIGELLGGYLGARSGIISLIGGRAFSGSETRSFAGDTFQFGPLAGIVVNLPRVNLFVEGAYMWRDFKSVEWDGDAPLGTLPRRINLTGPALSVGAQFKFRKGD